MGQRSLQPAQEAAALGRRRRRRRLGLLLAIPGAIGLLPDATTFVLYAGMLCPPVG
jgi:hypothetical protein